MPSRCVTPHVDSVAQALRELERQRQERAGARSAARARVQAEAELAARAHLRTQVEEQIHRIAQSQAERKLAQRANEEAASIALQEAQPRQTRRTLLEGCTPCQRARPMPPMAHASNPRPEPPPFAPAGCVARPRKPSAAWVLACHSCRGAPAILRSRQRGAWHRRARPMDAHEHSRVALNRHGL